MAKDETKAAPTKVKVKVVGQPVGEDGRIYKKGETFELDPARAAALGELVVPQPA